MKLMLAALAAAASPSISAPGSLASRRSMIDAYPIFFKPASAAGVVAPAHAIVVSTREKFVTPGNTSLVTPWAFRVTTSAASAQAASRRNWRFMAALQLIRGQGRHGNVLSG